MKYDRIDSSLYIKNRKKFKEYFDVFVLGFNTIDYLASKEFKYLLNKKSA